MNLSRRSLVSALGLLLPAGWVRCAAGGGVASVGPAPTIAFRPFEMGLREALRTGDALVVGGSEQPLPCYRIEIGYSPEVEAGLQGCHNDRPFAGFPAGQLRIIRAGSQPGRGAGGVRLYVTTVDVVLTRGRALDSVSRPLNFAALPPAPILS